MGGYDNIPVEDEDKLADLFPDTNIHNLNQVDKSDIIDL